MVVFFLFFKHIRNVPLCSGLKFSDEKLADVLISVPPHFIVLPAAFKRLFLMLTSGILIRVCFGSFFFVCFLMFVVLVSVGL